MTVALSQDKRLASLTTPLGKDVLGLTRFEGGEGLSELFEFRVEAVSSRQNIDFTNAIGRNCHVEYTASKATKRFFNGVLVEAQWIGVQEHDHAYRLVLRPWLWLLSHSSNCRIFREMNAPDIIKQVFQKAGFTDFRPRLTESYPVMEYCVQYRETDLAFVSRLMEQYGIYHYFEHTADKHTLVLADSSSSSHSDVPGGARRYNPVVDAFQGEREHIYQWMPERRFRTGKVDLFDYDYLQPNAELLAQDQASEGYNRADMKVYDFPGKYPRKDPNTRKNNSDGDRLAKIRLQAEQALDHRRHVAGDAATLYPGGLFTLEDHPCGEENQKYLVVRATHSFTAQQYRSGALGGDEGYHGSYEVLPTKRPYRTPIATPKPVVQGPQTAKVVGNAGEEIDVDEHGRIFVRFHWDRDKVSSRRVRVAQVWSGKSWGGQVIPRIGQEVVVDFLEGDPDRPLVVGTVYNQEYKYPYKLPDHKTMSGLKSDSTKGGRGFNEINFEDKKGSEKIYQRAEKDYQLLTRNTETREIGEAFATPNGKYSRKATLKNGDDELYVEKGNRKVDVAEEITVTAGKKIVLKVGESTITMDQQSITLKSLHITVTGTVDTKVTGSVNLVLKGGMVEIN